MAPLVNLFESYRKDFPVTGNYIYLDHAGVAPVSLRVRKAIEQFLAESAEGGAFYYPEWNERLASVRSAAARLLNADAREIAFVKNTSHGLSIVANGLDWSPGDNILIFEKEFPSNIFPWLNLERKSVEVRRIPSRNGRIVLEDIERRIDSKTRLLSISSVQFSTGFKIDLGKVGELCKNNNILFCVDAIQSLGIIPMDVEAYQIDFLSADGHKWLLGPEGAGIFYCRRELAERIHPPLIGWKSVKHDLAFDCPEFDLKTDALRFEEGSMNLIGIFGLGAAIDLLLEIGIEKIHDCVCSLGDSVIEQAEERGYTVLTPRAREERGGNITFSGSFNPASVRDMLREKRIMVNCRGGGLRVSPHFYNTNAEVKRFFRVLSEVT